MKKLLSIFLLSIFVITGCTGGEMETVGDDVEAFYYSKGNANASVKIVEFSDYECPFCARFALEIFPLIKSEYIDTGKVQYSYRDFPLQFHKYSQLASESTYCAGEQNEESFWDLHKMLFENQTDLKEEDLIKYADNLDLNVDAFKECLDSGKFKDIVLKNRQDGFELGVEATPTIMINDVKLTGFHPFESIKKVIDTELKK